MRQGSPVHLKSFRYLKSILIKTHVFVNTDPHQPIITLNQLTFLTYLQKQIHCQYILEVLLGSYKVTDKLCLGQGCQTGGLRAMPTPTPRRKMSHDGNMTPWV